MTESPPHEQQTLALAVVFLALIQVRDMASEGRCDEAALQTCLRGLLYPPEGTMQDLFGGLEPLRDGLRQLRIQLSRQPDIELTRYAVAVLNLERRLVKRRAVLKGLNEGLDKARQQFRYFGAVNEPVIASLAEVYTTQISTLGHRIVVRGRREWLEDQNRAARIRCLLLAAIRGISFWRSAGGNRFQLMFGRGRLDNTSARLLDP